MIFFNNRKPRSFNYQPRYYNEITEKRKQMEAKYNGTSDTNYESRIRGEFRRSLTEDREYRQKKKKKSNLRLFVIIGIVLLVAYIYMKFFLYIDFGK